MSNTTNESGVASPGPAHICEYETVNSIEEAERIAVGREFGFPVIAVAHGVGPGPRDLETVQTRRFYADADRNQES